MRMTGDLDAAQPARSGGSQARVVAERGKIDASLRERGQHGNGVRKLPALAVDRR